MESSKYSDNNGYKWDAIAESIDGCNEETLSYFKSLEDSNGVIDKQAASLDGLSAYLKKEGISAKFAAAKTALLNTALNAGIMLAVTIAIKLLVQALDNAADSLEDVESRIQDNQTALSNYTSKVEELSKRLEDLNQTKKGYLSEDEREELETEAAYINSQIELYNQLAETKQKAINDDYIKATMGSNQELYFKKMWEYFGEEFNENGLEALFHETPKELRPTIQDSLIFPFSLFKKVDDGNYITEANKLLGEYQELQNKYVSLQQLAIQKGNNETLDNIITNTQSQMHQTAAELSQYIEQIQTARDALYNSANKDDYADIIAEMDEAIANYQNALTGNVYASKYLGISDLQRDLIGIRDVLQTVSQDIGDLTIFDPIIEQINELIAILKLYEDYSFEEILNLDKIFLTDKLQELLAQLHTFREVLNDNEFLDKFKARLSDSLPPELIKNWERFSTIIKDIQELFNSFIQDIASKTVVSDMLDGMEKHLDNIWNVLSDIIKKFGWIFQDSIDAWNEAHDLDYSERTENNTAQNTGVVIGAENAAGYINDTTTFNDIFALEDAEGKLNTLGQLNEKLNNIQTAYKNLTDVMDTYSSTGSITIDQFQSIVEQGSEFLDYLTLEDGQLGVNEQAMYDLAEARITEMKAQMVQGVINNVSKIESEEDAAKYLSSANYELAESYDELADSQLDAWVKSAFINGLSQDTVDSVLQKAQNDIDKINALVENIDLGNIGGNAKNSASAAQSFTELLDKELAVLDKKMKAGYTDFNDYIQARLALIEDYYRQGKLSADEYYSYLEKHYQQELSYRDKVINAVTRRIDKEIDSLEKQKDKIKENYQIQIDALNEQKTLLQDANKERQRQIDMQKAMYELERAKNQRTTLIYSEDRGMHYVADDQAIRDAEQNVEDKEFEFKIAEIEKSISNLEQARDAETNAIDAMIDKLQEYKDQWNDITSSYEQSQEDLFAAQILGQEWEQDVINARLDTLNKFKDDYIKIQQAMVDAAYQAAQAMEKHEKVEIGDSSKEGSSTPEYNVKKYHTGLKQGPVDKHSFDDDFRLVQKVGLGDKDIPAILKEGEVVATQEQIHNLAAGIRNSEPNVSMGRNIDAANGTFVTPDGHVLRPLQPGDEMYDLVQKWNAYMENIDYNVEQLTTNAIYEHNRQMQDSMNQASNASIFNSKNIQPTINQEFNISLPNVTNSTSAEALMRDLQSIAIKKYQVNW